MKSDIKWCCGCKKCQGIKFKDFRCDQCHMLIHIHGYSIWQRLKFRIKRAWRLFLLMIIGRKDWRESIMEKMRVE